MQHSNDEQGNEGFVQTILEMPQDSKEGDEQTEGALLCNAAERVALLYQQYPERFDEKHHKKLSKWQKEMLDVSKAIQFPKAKKGVIDGTDNASLS